MSSKQKIAISAIGIVLVLAIIGLTIGLVLVASQAEVGSSMTVSYGANHVACTIKGSAVGTGIEPATITATHSGGGAGSDATQIKAAATETITDGMIVFDTVEIKEANGTVTYTFVITNDAEDGGDEIYAHATLTAAATNMTIKMGAPGEEVDITDDMSYTTPAIAATQSATISITVSVSNPATSANWDETQMSLIVNKTA